MKEALKNFLFVLENDKKIRMNRLNKNVLKLELEKKKSALSYMVILLIKI